ncbi:tubulin polyglutamylase TTLL5 isoform X2 [Polypterus senegalus]|uniref:tubulin polyglutamylase TTLL5 isoform X2 n=1 Tax=Polypterus senegalus TaxID=55291 RepID=UPI0019640E5B|nr:tubulin polyglutamylase TTLL5 isoform X2 [Polypterus senegalus]
MPAVNQNKEDLESSSEEEEQGAHHCIAWSGNNRKVPILIFHAEALMTKDNDIRSIGARYHLAYKIVRTESRLVRSILTVHGFHEVHPNSNDFNLMWTGSHPKPFILRGLMEFQKVNHFPRSYELTRKDRLYKNIQRMQQVHGFKNFHIVPQTFVLPSEYQEFCSAFSKDKGPWIIKPVASSRGRGIYLVSNPNQIPLDENILVSRYINNPLLIDDFKFDVRLYVLVSSYDPLVIYLYEEGLARFATVKYDRASKNIKNQFMHLTNYSVNKKSSDYVSCDDPEVEDYGNKWSMSAMLRYLKQEGKDTASLMAQIEDLIVKTILAVELHIASACKMFMSHRGNCFELYGFDVLIDSTLKPWLLEVNLSPSLACDAPLDLKIKASMISDMFSLVGFVCQDPLQKQNKFGKASLDPILRYQASRTQRQRPMSANDADSNGLKEKQQVGHGRRALGLTSEELKVLRRIKEEHERRGGFIRVFPTSNSWEIYGSYLEYKTSMNYMLATRLFPEKSCLHRNVAQGPSVFCPEVKQHVVQYERKLLSLEARRRRKRKITSKALLGKKSGLKEKMQDEFHSAEDESDHEEENESEIEEEEEEEEDEEEEVSQKQDCQNKDVHSESQNSVSIASETRGVEKAHEDSVTITSQPKQKVDLLQKLQQGQNLSKVQARMAFSSYLQRVEKRLMEECCESNDNSAWAAKEDEQMELVIRFLKRAASNLQQALRMVLPSRRLPFSARRRILSHQLGEFIHCYNKETEQMLNKMESLKKEVEQYVNADLFEMFVTEASESDLEEVLTYYTHKNKSASVFLGTGPKTTKCGVDRQSEIQRKFRTQKTLSSKDEESCTSESSTASVVHSSCSPKSSAENSKSQSIALDYAQIYSHRPASSTSHATSSTSAAAAAASSPSGDINSPQWSSVLSRTASATNLSRHSLHQEGLRPCRTGTCLVPSSDSMSSLPSATQIYSQKLSRPTSARHVSTQISPIKSRPGYTVMCKEGGHIFPQYDCSQVAIATALQRLAEKQASRQYSASSHISLLTQHLSNLNLSNGAFSHGSSPFNPACCTAASSSRPLRGLPSETALASNIRAVKERNCTLDGDPNNSCSIVPGVTPQQRYHPASGCYQLQFAIQQLQQQKLQSRQLLDLSRARHQAILEEHPLNTNCSIQALDTGNSANPWPLTSNSNLQGSSVGTKQGLPPTTSHLAPKPPTSKRSGVIRKSATQRSGKSHCTN